MIVESTRLVTEDNLRPAIAPAPRCGYCKSNLGEQHEADCVCFDRTVVLRVTVTFDYLERVPASWDAETITFCRGGGSSFCYGNNLAPLLRALADELDADGRPPNRCGCEFGPAEFVREAEPEHRRCVAPVARHERIGGGLMAILRIAAFALAGYVMSIHGATLETPGFWIVMACMATVQLSTIGDR